MTISEVQTVLETNKGAIKVKLDIGGEFWLHGAENNGKWSYAPSKYQNRPANLWEVSEEYAAYWFAKLTYTTDL